MTTAAALMSAIVLVLAFVFAMLGLGGGILYVPLIHAFGYDFKSVAIPVGLLLNGVTALSAALFYLRSKMVDIKGAIPLVISTFVGAPVGAYFTKSVPTNMLILGFVVAMVIAGGRMLITAGRADKGEMMAARSRVAWMSAGGFVIGLIAGLLGVGGGFLMVPMMLAMGYDTKKAAATSAFVVIFSSFSGFAGHIAEAQRLDWPLMIATSSAVIIGSQIGARLMKDKMKPSWIKRMFGVTLMGVAVKLLWRVL